MNKRNILIGSILAFLAVAILWFLFFGRSASQTGLGELDRQITFYYGENCPHCHNVIQYVEANNIASRVAFTQKEVSGSVENGNEFLEVVERCKLKPEVPLLYARGECYQGETAVVDFLKKEAEIAQ